MSTKRIPRESDVQDAPLPTQVVVTPVDSPEYRAFLRSVEARPGVIERFLAICEEMDEARHEANRQRQLARQERTPQRAAMKVAESGEVEAS